MVLRPIVSIFLAFVTAAPAQAGDGIDGRYGRTEIRYLAGKPAVFHQGRNVLTVNEADEAAIFHVVPAASQDYVVIKSWKPGLSCHNSYRLISIQPNGTVQASPELGNCTDLAGVSLAGSNPIIHLRQAAGAKVEQLIWKDGRVIELPPVSEACFTKHEQGMEKGGRIKSPQAGPVTAAGESRLQFYSGPDESCPIAGTFVVPGDHLDVSSVNGRYSLVVYQHPRTGKIAVGWVDSVRLKPTR